MWNVCWNCGEYRVEKQIVTTDEGTSAICPECDFAHTICQQPLLIVCGASSVGKTTVSRKLQPLVPQVLVLEGDLTLRGQGIREFCEEWLRLVKNIAHQLGKPVLLMASGMIPPNVEPCIERRYIGAIHYLALTCAETTLRERLLARPAWRGSHETIKPQSDFNRWIREKSGLEMIDTTSVSAETTTQQVAQWVQQTLA